MPRRPLRTRVKWAFTLAAIISSALAAASRFCIAGYSLFSSDGTTSRSFSLGDGLLEIYTRTGWPPGSDSRNRGGFVAHDNRWLWANSHDKRFYPGNVRGGLGLLSWTDVNAKGLALSVLYPVALTTIPAALLWYAQRPRAPHVCKKCHYDRRGLPPNAKCPECGATPPPASRPGEPERAA